MLFCFVCVTLYLTTSPSVGETFRDITDKRHPSYPVLSTKTLKLPLLPWVTTVFGSPSGIGCFGVTRGNDFFYVIPDYSSIIVTYKQFVNIT